MKTKTLLIIIAVFVVLVGVWMWTSRKPENNSAQITDWGFSKITSQAIDEIKIEQGSNKLLIQKKNGAWEVDGKKVNQTALDRVWEDFAKTTLSGPVSKNKENQARFNLDDANATKLTFSNASKPVLALMFGKTAPEAGMVYVRQSQNNNVYIASSSLSTIFPLTAKDWQVEEKATEPAKPAEVKKPTTTKTPAKPTAPAKPVSK